jgi:hypothetical protein
VVDPFFPVVDDFLVNLVLPLELLAAAKSHVSTNITTNYLIK